MTSRKIAVAAAILIVGAIAASMLRPRPSSRSIIATPAQAEGHSANSAYEIFLNIPAAAGSRSEGIALLKRAGQLQAAGQYSAALEAYDRAAAKLPQIADWITVFAAGAVAGLGDTVEVARRLGSLDPDLAGDWGWLTRSRAFEKAGHRERALSVALDAAARGSSGKRAAAWLRVAQLRHDIGDKGERAAFVDAIKTAPEGETAAKAAAALSKFDDLTPDEHLLVGRALARNGFISSGVTQLKAALESGRFTAEQSADIRYELGRILFATGNYRDAIATLGDVPASADHAADARFLLGRTQFRLDRDDEGRATFQKLIDEYPTTRAATRALFYLADVAQDDGELDDALALFQRTAAAPARADESALALMRVGGIALINKQYAEAAAAFGQLRQRYPDGEYHDQATYWAAISDLRNDNTTVGNELLRELVRTAPLSYYGMRAAQQLDISPLQNLPSGPHKDAAVGKLVQAGMDRWTLLRDVGWNDAASFELGRLRKHFEDSPAATYAIAEQFIQRGAPHIAIAIGKDILESGGGWNRRLLRILYPMPYQKLIEREARARNLDPYFVAAVIRQESRFNKDAVSGAGAIGLMQVMPATGKRLGRKAGVRKVTAARLVQPEPNVKLGTRFLSDLMGMYDGRVAAVLVAYNAGPSRADRWRNFPEFSSEDLFIERIPFDETRAYVKVVKLNAAIYRALYGSQETAD